MKRIINLKTSMGILLLILMIFAFISVPVYGQFEKRERQPFDNTSPYSMPQNQNSPSTLGESPGGPSRGWWEGGEPDDPTGGNLGERDKVRGGVPIKDALWLLPFLAIGYGIYCRQRERGKN